MKDTKNKYKELKKNKEKISYSLTDLGPTLHPGSPQPVSTILPAALVHGSLECMWAATFSAAKSKKEQRSQSLEAYPPPLFFRRHRLRIIWLWGQSASSLPGGI